ncbi:hypothetical protein E5676_scaffold434G003940 [Cucumis melo var. makuwa]|uniref:Uncharacterized protein n=1 Tax=Cucumis melo var. makuwa TaxID=1194695 RepID=A0A5D3D1C1_CUCMM|nr:hypothetical protein E5676_scaffold434G003940 [Cucumis melo var. makuwa]
MLTSARLAQSVERKALNLVVVGFDSAFKKARLAQSVERKALILVVVGSNPTVGEGLGSAVKTARLAQSVERKALNLVVVGSNPTVGEGIGFSTQNGIAQGSWVRTTRYAFASKTARLAQLVERKALNLVVVGSSPTVGEVFQERMLLDFINSDI